MQLTVWKAASAPPHTPTQNCNIFYVIKYHMNIVLFLRAFGQNFFSKRHDVEKVQTRKKVMKIGQGSQFISILYVKQTKQQQYKVHIDFRTIIIVIVVGLTLNL